MLRNNKRNENAILGKPVFLLAAIITVLALVIIPASAQVNAPEWWGFNDNDTISLSYLFSTNDWPATPNISIAPAWFEGVVWTADGPLTLEYFNNLSGHQGAWGISGMQSGHIDISAKVDNEYRPGWIKHVWYQFDAYRTGGDLCIDTPLPVSGSNIINTNNIVTPLAFGWQRVTTSFDIIPQPHDETIVWQLGIGPGGIAAIDNVHISTHCELVPEPSGLAVVAAALPTAFFLRRKKNI